MRLPETTPVRMALHEYDRPLKMSRGGPKTTWGKTIKNDLTKLNIDRQKADELVGDRKQWRRLVHSVEAG